MDPLVNLTAAAQITSFAQLPVKRRGVLASGGQLLLQPGDERIEPAGSRCAHGPFGEALGPGEAAHGGAGQAGRFFDGAQRLSGRLTAADIMVVRQRACPAGDGGILRSSGAWKGTGAHALTRRRGQRRGGQLAQPTVHSEEPAREHLVDVLEQVPAVSDLHRTGHAQVHAALELAGSVARHHLDFTAARAQLGGQGLGPAVRQQVHRATALQIHEQGAVGGRESGRCGAALLWGHDQIRATATDKAALSEAGGDDLAAALAGVENVHEPTDHEAATVWDATFRRFVFLVEKGVTEGKAKRALIRILGRPDVAFVAATANARSKAWQRKFQKWNEGGSTLEALLDSRVDNGGRPEIFALTTEEKNALRELRLKKGSVNLAIEWFQKSPACRPETLRLILKALDDAARRRRAVNWPLSLRRAAYVTVEEQSKLRGAKKYQEVELVTHRGMWWEDENGERVPMRPNSIWESDDMSSNEPFCFVDPETSKAMVGRQTLCTQDVFSASFLSAMPIGRARDAYRAEDIADHLLETVRANGLPDAWRLERGAWENNMIDGIPLKDGTRWGGLSVLFRVLRTFKSRGKGTIESSFNMLQARLGHESLTIGRKRGEFEKGTKALIRARLGDESAVRQFWSMGEYANAACVAMRAFNATPKKRRAFGRDVVSPDDLYRTPDRRECPEAELWRFCPVKREATVRRGNVEVSVLNYPYPFCFRVNGNENSIHLENGYPVLIAFHPGHPERGCHLFNAERGPRNRDGLAFGEFLWVAPFADDSPQYGLSREDQALVARKRANAAVHQEFRNIVGSNARVSVVRDSHGRSARVENGTGGPMDGSRPSSIKEQRAAIRNKQADEFERAAKAARPDIAAMAAKNAERRQAARAELGLI